MVPTANQVIQVNPVFPATTHQFHWTKKANAVGAHPDRTVHQVHPAPAVQLASKATPALLAIPAKMARKDHPAHPVRLAKKEKMARTAKKENQAKMPNAEKKDHQAHQAKLENPAQLVQTATKVPLANQETKPTMARPDHPVKEANPETKDPPAHPARKAPPVQMPTIVLAHAAPPPRLPPPRPKRKKLHLDNDWRSIYKINYRTYQFGLTSAFNIGGMENEKFSLTRCLVFMIFFSTIQHASM